MRSTRKWKITITWKKIVTVQFTYCSSMSVEPTAKYQFVFLCPDDWAQAQNKAFISDFAQIEVNVTQVSSRYIKMVD